MNRKLFPSEAVVLAAAVAGVILYRYFDLPLRYPLQLYVQKLGGGLCWYSTGLVLCFLLYRLSGIRTAVRQGSRVPWNATWSGFCRHYLLASVLLRDLRLVHVLSLFFVVFLNLKHLIPLINPGLYDQQFASGDHFFCGGRLCSELLIQIFGVRAAQVFSSGYVFFYPYLGFLLMTMVLQRNEKLAQEFCLSFVLVWFLGLLLVYLIPTWGPCFSSGEIFRILPETKVTELQEELWVMKQYVEQFPGSEKGIFLISGFPSLHLAAAVLGSLYLMRIHWLLGGLSWIFSFLTLITTIYFGWHFVLDDVGGLALALLVYWWMAKRGRQSAF